MRYEEIRRLIKLVEDSDIGEVDVWHWGGRVRIRKPGMGSGVVIPQMAAPQAPMPVTSPAAGVSPNPAPDAPSSREDTSGLVPITSPMVGTFYRSPAPDADSYVDVGTTVGPGQTVCIIEAMKLMNEIQSEVRGRIAQILVENGAAVEYGQTLFLVEET